MKSPPLVVHLHAVVMASWVSLLAMQATLSLVGRMDLHRKWGLASLVVAPLVLTMLVVLLVPVLLYDLIRSRRIHGAWIWGFALLLPWMIATEFVWGSPWWRDFGPKLVGGEVEPEDLSLLLRLPNFVSGNWEKALSAHADFRWMKVS
jgi:hypothetical protein